jgi:hypothetical protein
MYSILKYRFPENQKLPRSLNAEQGKKSVSYRLLFAKRFMLPSGNKQKSIEQTIKHAVQRI